MPVLPSIFDPITNQFMDNFMSENEQMFFGLLGLSAFGMIGYGAFFTYGAAAATPPVLGVPAVVTFGEGTIGVGTATFVTGGTTLTAGQMLYLAEVQAGQIALSNGAVAAILESWGLQLLTVDTFLLLALYNVATPPPNPIHFGNFGSWLGGFTGLGGGFATPPGFPGFPGSPTHPPPGGGNPCYNLASNEYCYLLLF